MSLLPGVGFNQESDKVWKKKEVDRMLELYLHGADPKHIATQLHRTRKAVQRKLQEYIYNERDRVVNYTPRLRTSRKGQRFTANEKQIIQCCRDRGVSDQKIAILLARSPSEIEAPRPSDEAHKWYEFKKAATGVDLVLAYRYLYYTKGISIMPDSEYDALEKEEKEFGGGSKLLDSVGSDNPEDYPPHIRALALYLAFKYTRIKK